jgi:hypothetical protein
MKLKENRIHNKRVRNSNKRLIRERKLLKEYFIDPDLPENSVDIELNWDEILWIMKTRLMELTKNQYLVREFIDAFKECIMLQPDDVDVRFGFSYPFDPISYIDDAVMNRGLYLIDPYDSEYDELKKLWDGEMDWEDSEFRNFSILNYNDKNDRFLVLGD